VVNVQTTTAIRRESHLCENNAVSGISVMFVVEVHGYAALSRSDAAKKLSGG
jgi:hypothetical protein